LPLVSVEEKMSRNKILRENPQESFICSACGKGVSPVEFGGKHRNHCPHCLSSLHLDITPGDRRSSCKGLMKPISIHVQKNGEWSIVHKCTKCNTIRLNRIAADDNELLLFALATKPLMSLPFPSKDLLATLFEISIDRGGEECVTEK
jgi:DNA-directed RNA polymerase subunit RPC12/RpoP